MSALAVVVLPDRPSHVGRAIEVGFRLAGWFAVTALAVAGLFVVAFVMLGNFTFEGFFLQLANLATRYGAADAVRRAHFQQNLVLVAAILLGATMFFRRGTLARIFVTSRED